MPLLQLVSVLITSVCVVSIPYSNFEHSIRVPHHHIRISRDVSKTLYDEDMVEDDEDDGINWQCGTDDLSKLMSEASVEQTCPHLKISINNCCLSHDDCYDKQLGQIYCDNNFCRCLDVVTKHNATCNQGEAVIFCDLVRKYGAGPYAASATTKNIVTPTTNKYAVASITTKKTVGNGSSTITTVKSNNEIHLTSSTTAKTTDMVIIGKARIQTSTVEPIPDIHIPHDIKTYTTYTYTAPYEITTSSTESSTVQPNASRSGFLSFPSFPFPFPYPS